MMRESTNDRPNVTAGLRFARSPSLKLFTFIQAFLKSREYQRPPTIKEANAAANAAMKLIFAMRRNIATRPGAGIVKNGQLSDRDEVPEVPLIDEVSGRVQSCHFVKLPDEVRLIVIAR